MNDLLGFLSDDLASVEDRSASPKMPISPQNNNPGNSPDPLDEPEITEEIGGIEDRIADEPEITDPAPNPQTPETPSNEDEDDNLDGITPLGEDDIKNTFNLLKATGAVIVDDNYEFDGSIDEFEKVLTNTLDSMRQSARQALLEELNPEFREITKYALSKGSQASIQEYIQRVESSTSNFYADVDLSSTTNQEQIVRDYLQKTTKYDDNRINRHIDLLKQSNLLETEAKQSLAELVALTEEEKSLREQEYTNALAQRDEQRRQIRKQFETIIDNAEFIDTPRKGKVKAYINNLKQAKGQAPTTAFQSDLNTILTNQEHLAQLAAVIYQNYDPAKGFNFEQLAQKGSSKSVSTIREKLDKLITASGPRGAGKQQPRNEGFDWKSWASQVE